MREIVVFYTMLLFILACAEEPDCGSISSGASINVSFYDKEDSSALKMDFIGVGEKNTDNIFYTPEDTLSTFSLGLNPSTDQVTYIFLTSTSQDTLILGYSKKMEWLSEECGPFFFYEDLEVVGSTYTYELTSTFIDASIDENIKIYN